MLATLGRQLTRCDILQEIAFAPYDAVYRLAWCTPDSAYWEGFWRIFRGAVVTSGDALLDNLNLSIEARGPALDQRHVSCEAHFVHVTPCIHIVQGVEDDIEAAEPRYIELRFLDVRMMRLDLDFRIEPLCSLLGHLFLDVSVRQQSCRLLPLRLRTKAFDFLMCS